MLENKKVAHALVYDKSDLGINEEIRKSLKVFYKRNLYIDELKFNPGSCIIEDSVDKCLVTAANLDFDLLILTWEGNIFNIYEFHDEVLKSIKKLENETNGNWVVAGHIMDQYQNRMLYNPQEAEQYRDSFYLFPITALVNLKKWKEIGSPGWGDTTNKASVIKAKPSEETVHDNYTPLRLKPSNEIVETSVRFGWNIINETLKNNIDVFNIDNNIRETQSYLYPENNVDLYNNFWNHLHGLPKLSGAYEKVFSLVISCKRQTRIEKGGWAYFLRNTEEHYPYIRSDKFAMSGYDSFILPCSGFKDFIVSTVFLPGHEKSKFIHYDILKNCILIKRTIIEQWDGTRNGLSMLLKKIEHDYSLKGKFNCFHMNFMKTLDEVYDQILPYYDNEESLENHWLEFQKKEHSYIQADILSDRDKIVQISKRVYNDKTYFSMSDVAGWRMNLLGYSIQGLRDNMKFAISTIVKNKDNSVIDYKDPATDCHYLHTYQDALTHLNSNYNVESNYDK